MSNALYPKTLLDQFAAWGAKGGRRRAKTLSKERLSEIGRKAGIASAKKRKRNGVAVR